jgi:hypothetical protein
VWLTDHPLKNGRAGEKQDSDRIVGNPYLGITSGLPELLAQHDFSAAC